MKKFNVFKLLVPSESNKIAFQGGSYSLTITAVVLTILLIINIFVSALPSNLTKYDISASKLYSITSNTKVVVNALEEDVNIYWVVQAGGEDEVIDNLLAKYASLSEHIKVVKKNPDIYPMFTQQYTEEAVANNSLIVECGERNRYIGYDDIYLQEADLYSYNYNTSFDGEGAITSAIDYVVNEQQPKLYVLEGHGEAELPSTFSEQIKNGNIEILPLSLLKVDKIPEDADCIMIYAPASDISVEEKTLLSTYASNGGKFMTMAGPTAETSFENLYSLLSAYGVSVGEGIIVEADREHYAFRSPHVLIPDMSESEITNSLMEEKYYPLMPISQPLIIAKPDDTAVTALMTTSDVSYSKIAGHNLSTYDKEDGDIDGPFTVAVSIDTGNSGKMVWFGSSSFLDDKFNAYSSGANVDLGMNALSSLIGESEAMAIRSKSLNYNYLTISDSTSSLLKVLMVGIFPLAYLGIGIGISMKKRRAKHGTL